MDRSAFIKTLIEVLKYDRKYRTIESRDQLLRLIGRARVNFVPQYEFANHGVPINIGRLWNYEFRFLC